MQLILFINQHSWRLTSVLSVVLFLAGCAMTRTFTGKIAHKAYRMDTNASTTADAFKLTTQALESGVSSIPVRLGFLEFDDQGELWRLGNQDGGATQLRTVLEDMNAQMKKGPMKTIVFIHGWRNDASPHNEESGNLASFKTALENLAKSCEMPVYGVYVAWRGGSYPSPDNVFIDVWDRDAAAKRVGGPTMLASLRALTSMAHRNPTNRVIMVGHSFGGKILTQVASQHLSGEIGRAIGSGNPKITPLADTVVVVNSATNGPEMRQVQELMKDHQISYKQNGRELPLFITIASNSDFWVRRALPVYLRFNRDVLAFPDRAGHVANRSQNDSLYSAMGFNPSMIDYELLDDTGKPANYPSIKWSHSGSIGSLVRANLENGLRSNSSKIWVTLQTSIDPESKKDFTISRIRPTVGGYVLPYLGLTVPDFIVKGHSDLWNPNLVGMISAFEAMGRPLTHSRQDAASVRPQLTVKKLIN